MVTPERLSEISGELVIAATWVEGPRKTALLDLAKELAQEQEPFLDIPVISGTFNEIPPDGLNLKNKKDA